MKWKRLLTRDANILLKSLVIKGVSVGPKYVFPEWHGFKNQYWSWHHGETGVHYRYDELEQFSTSFLQYALAHQDTAENYLVLSKKICNDAAQKTKQLSQQVTQHLSNKALYELFAAFCDTFLSLGTTIVMTLEELQKEILPILQKKLPGRPASEVLGMLVTPSDLSIEAQEESSRLKIIEEVSMNPTYKKLFQQDIEIIKQELYHYPELEQEINIHLANYCWIPLNFEKPLWDIDFFIKIFKNYLQELFDYKKRKNELETYTERREFEKKQYSEKLQLNKKEKTIIDLLYVSGYIRLYRATMFSFVYYNAFPLLNEIAGRLGITLDVLKYYTYQEISDALLVNKKLSVEQGRNRVNSFVIFIENNHYQQFEGEEAEKVIQRETPQEEIKETNEVKGMCAYPGKVIGNVKVIRDAREMNKINQGDILICKETNPDLVIAMEKAGAIVTDEGGLTSHAAIVSREMKKPCIIGTKIATKIFKDNDYVKVDAENGLIRKL